MPDACENLDFVMSLFTPSDVDASMDRHQMAAMLANTTKPIVYVTMNDVTAHLDVTAMAEAVAGGERRCASARSSPATRTRCSRWCTTPRRCARCSTSPARACRASTAPSARPAPWRR